MATRPVTTTSFDRNIHDIGNMFGNTNVLQGWVQGAIRDAKECDIKYALRGAMRLGVAFKELRERVQNDRSLKGTAHMNALSVVMRLQQNALHDIVSAFEENCSPIERAIHTETEFEDFWEEPIK